MTLVFLRAILSEEFSLLKDGLPDDAHLKLVLGNR